MADLRPHSYAAKDLIAERRDALMEAAAYCRDLSELSYRGGNLLIAAAQDAMARELERRAQGAPMCVSATSSPVAKENP